MSVTFHTKFNHIPRISASIRPKASQVVRATAHGIEGDIKNAMRSPKSGRVYRRGGRSHQASAPGEAPAVDMGQLINSIQVTNVSELTSVIGTNVRHAIPLEFGSRKMAPRPIWRPTVEKWRQPFIDAMRQVLSQLK